jgi:hypothetical protein
MFPEINWTTTMHAWWIAAWVVYTIVYAATLTYLLNRRRFESNERILWFLVITFAPVLGILLFILIGGDDRIPPESLQKMQAAHADKTTSAAS